MENFSLCVLQKNNCMCNSAEIPTLPDPAAQATFRGKPLTHETAQDLFMGWLGKEAYSWKVVSVMLFLVHRGPSDGYKCRAWLTGSRCC